MKSRLQDPRVVGKRYYNAYWGECYTVLSIQNPGKADWSITVKWDKGNTTTHCTAFDHKRDKELI